MTVCVCLTDNVPFFRLVVSHKNHVPSDFYYSLFSHLFHQLRNFFQATAAAADRVEFRHLIELSKTAARCCCCCSAASADDSGLSSRPFKIAFLNTQITNHCEACNLSHKSFHFCPALPCQPLLCSAAAPRRQVSLASHVVVVVVVVVVVSFMSDVRSFCRSFKCLLV